MPTAYGHREVLVQGYVDEVVIACGAEIIARHPRSYAREDFIFEPLHYLALLEQKIGALDQAAPLQGWDLPESFTTLRRLLEARMGKAGKREYVQVLRLLETFRLEDVQAGVREALRLGAIGFDAVKHLVLCRIERRPPRLDLTVYPYLPRAAVATTSAKAYMALLGEATAMSDAPAGAAGPSSEGAEAADLPARVRQAGAAVRGRGRRPYAATCCAWPSWSCSSASGGWSSGASARRGSRRSRAWTASTSPAIPSLNKTLVLELARCEYVERRENVIALGNSGTGKTHVALGLGLAACQKGLSVGFTTAAALVHELLEAQGREAAAAPAEAACRLQAADHRRTRLRAAVADRGGVAVRGLQPALRARARSS